MNNLVIAQMGIKTYCLLQKSKQILSKILTKYPDLESLKLELFLINFNDSVMVEKKLNS